MKGTEGGIVFGLSIKTFTKREYGADHGEMVYRLFENRVIDRYITHQDPLRLFKSLISFNLALSILHLV